jgi:1,4-alpha-glucan branching enzyme
MVTATDRPCANPACSCQTTDVTCSLWCGALDRPAARPVLAQAARELLLAQASDWQFIISTGVAADYAERRFLRHCDDAGDLLAALIPGAETRLPSAQANAERLHRRDDLFPDILSAVANAIG